MSFDLPLDRMDWQAFRNDSGEVVPAFGIMAITGVLVRDDDALLTIDKPSVTFCWQYAVNGEAEVSVGGYGNCTLTSPCAQYYDTGTPAAKEGWGPKPGQWTLSKGFPATTIVNGIGDATNKILYGSFAEITTALIRFTGSVSNNTSTTTYKIYAGTMGSEADAGFTTVPSARNRTGARVTNDWALLVRINDGWEIVNLEGGGSDPEIYNITIPAPGVASLASISVTIPSGTVSAENWSDATMTTGDYAHVYRNPDDGLYYLFKTGGSSQSYGIIEGGVAANFTKTTIAFLANVIHDDDGNLSLGDQVMVWNPSDPATGNLVFEGSRNAACQFRYSPSDGLYRAIWVACPDDAVQVGVGGEGSQSINLGSYGAGGQPDIVSNVYFGEV